MRATCDLTNCSTSAAAINRTCCQDLPIPPRTITFRLPGPSFLYTSKGREKKRSKDLHEQFTFTPKPLARKVRKVSPDAIARHTRSQTQPVSGRTRSKNKNAPTISTRTADQPKRAAHRPIEQAILMEFDVTIDVKLEGEVTRSEPNGHVGETDCSDPYDHLERHRNEVKMYELQFESKRHKAEADQELQRQKTNEEERQKNEKVKDKWDKILRRGAYKEIPKKKKEKKKSGEHDLTSLGTSTSEGARDKTQAHKKKKKKKKKERRRQYETQDVLFDRTPQDNQEETPKRKNPLWPWFWLIVTSLSFWYYWKYRTIAGLIWFLWAFSTIFNKEI